MQYSLKATLMSLGVAGLFAILPPAISHAQYNSSPEEADSATVGGLLTKISLRSALSKGRVNQTRFYDAQAMKDFYKALDHKTFWVRSDGLRPDTRDVFKTLSASWTHGLNPDDYHVEALSTLLSRDAVTDKARLELLMTDGMIRYMHDLSGMRIDPASIHQKAEYWQPQKDVRDLYIGLIRTNDVEDYIESTAPQGALYKKLQQELVRLSRQRSDYDDVLPLDFDTNYFKPGDKSEAVKGLRIRLGQEYDPQLGDENYYDDALAAALMALQKKHGLDADGIVGPQTLDVLNNSRVEQMKQIVANMERLRWLDREKPDRYMLVNIASQTLWGIDEGQVKLEMPVIVGLPYRRTKSFKTEVTGVRFNPDWTVPQSIKMRDFLPKLKKGGPDYLDYKGIEVIRGYGSNARTLDPYAIDWNNIGWREMGKLRMVQTPGDHNALGRIRILMQNKYNIYLHDTNHPELFSRSQRTLSSGCIRLSDPEKVARFVLDKNERFTDYMMKNILGTTRLTEVDASKRMPIYIIYQSVWLDKNNELVYGADVYKRDKELLDVLEAANGYYLPKAGDVRFAKNDDEGSTIAYNNVNE